MDITIIPDTWPPRHNTPAEPDPPPPFGTPRPCAGCGLPAPRGSRWCATCRADVPAPEPRSTRHLDANRAWAREVARRLDLIALPLVPVAPDYADWACLRCGDDVEDLSECWCVACQRDLAKGA